MPPRATVAVSARALVAALRREWVRLDPDKGQCERLLAFLDRINPVVYIVYACYLKHKQNRHLQHRTLPARSNCHTLSQPHLLNIVAEPARNTTVSYVVNNCCIDHGPAVIIR